MKKLTKRLICLAIAAVLLAGAGAGALMLSAAGAGASSFGYQYVLVPRSKVVGSYDGVSDGEVILDLYVVSKKPDGSPTAEAPALQSGSFGLRLPDWVTDVKFELDSSAGLQKTMETNPARYDYSTTAANMNARTVYRDQTGDRYHFFTWHGSMEGDDIRLTWVSQTAAGGCYGIKLGAYSFKLPVKNGTDAANGYRLPMGGDVSLLDWLSAKESVPTERGLTEAEADESVRASDKFNKTIWNPTTDKYQGYYNDGLSVPLIQTDIDFVFQTPPAWASITPVFSYDPKKTVSGNLYTTDGSNTLVATLDPNKNAQGIWNSTDKDVDSWCYPETGAANGDTGVGPYYTGIRLDNPGLYFQSGQSIAAGTKYLLELSKPGSLTETYEITAAVDNSLEGATGLPASGEAYHLLAGDLNNDGRIDMADRSVLLGRLGQQVPEKDYTDMTPAEKLVYAADLDGDGFVTMADLSILMAPENFLHESN